MRNTLSLLVDAASVVGDPELPHLLSFDQVDGLSVEQQVTFIEQPGQDSIAVLGKARTNHVSFAPFHQFKRIAARIAARPGCQFTADVIERALGLSFLARRLGADAVVSPSRSAFGPSDRGLLDVPALVTVAEALALIGAHARQRDTVPLGGTPLLVQQRTEVYPLTAMAIIPNGQDWWSSCVRTASPERQEWLGYAEAVFKRVGQALRGRDGVHEALRVGSGRSAILDALYHFDVVLTSSVGALDALARVAHEVLIEAPGKLTGKDAAWQRDEWRDALGKEAPDVAAVVAPGTRLGSGLRVLTNTRNSIHNIPLDEYLHVERGGHTSSVEHRVMIAPELNQRLRDVGAPLAPFDRHGLHTDRAGTPFLNIAEFAERLLTWTIEIVGELLGAMLSCRQLARGDPLHLPPIRLLERQFCAALARVGTYPCRAGPVGLPAGPSLHRTVMASIHRTHVEIQER